MVSDAVKKDIIPLPDKIGQVVGMVFIVIFVAFFVKHQTDSTGFFTSEFGTAEAIVFYAAALFGLVTGSAKIVFGRKNRVRPIELIGNILWIVVSVWMLVVFPFDFAHLADVLPEYLQPLLDWVSNDIGRILVVLGTIGGFIALFITSMLYIFVGKRLAEPVEKTEEETQPPENL
ncbi:MAG TPA: hypothetical protein ENN25_02155 [Euryarchaeota archaeon]|nr:hypothetical protein [Euryarchaeota archaeon]